MGTKLHTDLDAEKAKGDAARESFKATIDANKANAMATLNEAIMNQNKALLAYHYDTMMANAKAVGEEMKNNVALIEASLDNAREAANAELKNADAASLARYNEVIQAVKDGVEAGAKAAD